MPKIKKYTNISLSDALVDVLEEVSPRRILIVHGSKSYNTSGAKGAIEQVCHKFDIDEIIVSEKYLSLLKLTKLIKEIKRVRYDLIIGMGGGIVLDATKIMSLIINNEGTSSDILRYIEGTKMPVRTTKMLLVPTTSGTGAEVTPFSVVYIGGIKHSLSTNELTPDYIILDPQLTHSLDKFQTAVGGCDAIAQAIESFWSISATKESQLFSEKALRYLLPSIVKTVNQPDPKSRRKMLIGAHYSGMAISIAKTTISHAISYPLTSKLGISHGHAVMLTLPYIFELFNHPETYGLRKNVRSEYLRQTIEKLLRIMGVSSCTEAKKYLLKLMEDLHLPTYVSTNEKICIEDLVSEVNTERLSNFPISVDQKTIRSILRVILV